MEAKRSAPETISVSLLGGSACCSLFPNFRSTRSNSFSWKRIPAPDFLNNHHRPDPRWWIRAILKIREWSEISAGSKWKNFIRRFNRDRRRSGDWDDAAKFQYDPLSYALNFEDEDEYEDANTRFGGFQSFSKRFASVPIVSSGKSPTALPAIVTIDAVR